MGKKQFPQTVYGRDSFRGRSGPQYTDPGDGFAPNSGYEGSGYELQYFRGQYLDHLSIIEILDKEAAEEMVRESYLDREFLSRMGFGRDGSTLKN